MDPMIVSVPMDFDDRGEWCRQMRLLAEQQVLRAVAYSKSFEIVDGRLVLHGGHPEWDVAIHPFNQKVKGFEQTLAARLAVEAQISMDKTLEDLERESRIDRSIDDINRVLLSLGAGWTFSDEVMAGPLRVIVAKLPLAKMLAMIGEAKADTMAQTEERFIALCWRKILSK